jgi:two-component system, LytTR family, response regulator
MKLTTIIVEDVKRSQQTLQTMLEDYCPSVEVVGTAATPDEAIALIQKHRPQLVMLDVELRRGNGFDVLENLPDLFFEVIFTTADDRYAIRAIEFSALAYLVKPIAIKKLIAAVNKAHERGEDQQLKVRYELLLQNLKNPPDRLESLAVPTVNGYEMVSVKELIRCEGYEGYTKLILTTDRIITTTRRLKEWDEMLEDQNFFRIHRSHLINLNYLKRYARGSGGSVTMSDGTEIAVSRRRKDALLQRLNQR